MKLITKKTDYAIRALMYLGLDKGRYHSVKEIAKNQNIPYQFLRSIINGLIRAEMIISKEGASGGVRMAKEPRLITVSDVINIFQGRIQLSGCMFRKKICSNRSDCALRNHMLGIEKLVSKEFNKITIAFLSRRIKR